VLVILNWAAEPSCICKPKHQHLNIETGHQWNSLKPETKIEFLPSRSEAMAGNNKMDYLTIVYTTAIKAIPVYDVMNVWSQHEEWLPGVRCLSLWHQNSSTVITWNLEIEIFVKAYRENRNLDSVFQFHNWLYFKNSELLVLYLLNGIEIKKYQ